MKNPFLSARITDPTITDSRIFSASSGEIVNLGGGVIGAGISPVLYVKTLNFDGVGRHDEVGRLDGVRRLEADPILIIL